FREFQKGWFCQRSPTFLPRFLLVVLVPFGTFPALVTYRLRLPRTGLGKSLQGFTLLLSRQSPSSRLVPARMRRPFHPLNASVDRLLFGRMIVLMALDPFHAALLCSSAQAGISTTALICSSVNLANCTTCFGFFSASIFPARTASAKARPHT